MTTGNKIRKGALWSFMGNTGSQILNFSFGIVLARLLAPEIFGALLTIQVFTGVAGFIAGAGMGQALVQAKDTSRADYDIVFTLQLLIGIVIYGIFFTAGPFIANWYNTPLYCDLIRVSALSFIFRPFNNVPASILQRDMRFKDLTMVRVVSLLASNISSIALAHNGFGVWSLILGGMTSALVMIPLHSTLAKWRPGFSINIGRARDIARYGMLVSATDILVYLRTRASAFILSRTLGPAAIGQYNKGESLSDMPNGFITGSVYQALFPALSANQDNKDKCRYMFYRAIALVAVYGTPFYVGLLWLAKPIIVGLYGTKWAAAAGPLWILAFAWPFWLLDMLSGAVLAAFAWLHFEVISQTATLIVTCLAISFGLQFGIEGVACAVVASAAFSAIFMHCFAVRCLRARWYDFAIALIPAAILNLTLAASLFVADRLLSATFQEKEILHVVTMTAIGGLIYMVSFFALPIPALINEKERWRAKLVSSLRLR